MNAKPRMRTALACLLTLAAGCTGTPPARVSGTPHAGSGVELAPHPDRQGFAAALPPVHTGPEVVARLQGRYADARMDCGSARRPAFLCSGIIIRGTSASTAYHFWDPSPKDKADGGVAFSYLRHDAKLARLAYTYTHGYILYPMLDTPEGMDTELDIACAFPVDGQSDSRTAGGCGASTQYPAQSGPCQAQGIVTAQAWYRHWRMTPAAGNPYKFQCPMTVTEGTPDAASMFAQFFIASYLLAPAEPFDKPNELVVKTWIEAPGATPTKLPVEALFYWLGKTDALADARYEQQDLYEHGGRTVPIVRLVLPRTRDEEATFSYSAADQAVPMGEDGKRKTPP
ncbi:MAG: hypothetical protein ABWZ85_00540 [Luteibacter sp.]